MNPYATDEQRGASPAAQRMLLTGVISVGSVAVLTGAASADELDPPDGGGWELSTYEDASLGGQPLTEPDFEAPSELYAPDLEPAATTIDWETESDLFLTDTSWTDEADTAAGEPAVELVPLPVTAEPALPEPDQFLTADAEPAPPTPEPDPLPLEAGELLAPAHPIPAHTTPEHTTPEAAASTGSTTDGPAEADAPDAQPAGTTSDGLGSTDLFPTDTIWTTAVEATPPTGPATEQTPLPTTTGPTLTDPDQLPVPTPDLDPSTAPATDGPAEADVLDVQPAGTTIDWEDSSDLFPFDTIWTDDADTTGPDEPATPELDPPLWSGDVVAVAPDGPAVEEAPLPADSEPLPVPTTALDATPAAEAPLVPPVASPALSVRELPELREQLDEFRETYGPVLQELVGSLVSDRSVDRGEVLTQVRERLQTVADGSAAPRPWEALVAALPADLQPTDLPLAQIRQTVQDWGGSGTPGGTVAPWLQTVSADPPASTTPPAAAGTYRRPPDARESTVSTPVMRCGGQVTRGGPVTRGSRCGGGGTVDLNGPITSPTLSGAPEDPRWTPTERNLWKVSRDRQLVRQEEHMVRLQIRAEQEQGRPSDDPLLLQLQQHHQQLQLRLQQLDKDWYKWHNQRSREGGRRH